VLDPLFVIVAGVEEHGPAGSVCLRARRVRAGIVPERVELPAVVGDRVGVLEVIFEDHFIITEGRQAAETEAKHGTQAESGDRDH
jgi:hypothetical protein